MVTVSCKLMIWKAQVSGDPLYLAHAKSEDATCVFSAAAAAVCTMAYLFSTSYLEKGARGTVNAKGWAKGLQEAVIG